MSSYVSFMHKPFQVIMITHLVIVAVFDYIQYLYNRNQLHYTSNHPMSAPETVGDHGLWIPCILMTQKNKVIISCLMYTHLQSLQKYMVSDQNKYHIYYVSLTQQLDRDYQHHPHNPTSGQ